MKSCGVPFVDARRTDIIEYAFRLKGGEEGLIADLKKAKHCCEAALELLEAPPVKKCLVKGCENHSNQGTFIGDLCAPCHHYLTSDEVGPTNSLLGSFPNQESIPHKKGEREEAFSIIGQVQDMLKELSDQGVNPTKVALRPSTLMALKKASVDNDLYCWFKHSTKLNAWTLLGMEIVANTKEHLEFYLF